MTVAFDTLAGWNDTASPITGAYTPTGTLRGVLALIFHDGSTDLVSAVVYGGAALARVRTDIDTNVLPFRTYIYFLGTGIPTGTQNMVVTHSGSVTNVIGRTVGLTSASVDTEVVDHDGVSEDDTAPDVTLQYAGRTCQAYAVLVHGGTVALTASLTGQTRLNDQDQGAWCFALDRQTTPGTADFTIGFDCTGQIAGAEHSAFSAVAVSEVVPVATGGGRLIGPNRLARVA